MKIDAALVGIDPHSYVAPGGWERYDGEVVSALLSSINSYGPITLTGPYDDTEPAGPPYLHAAWTRTGSANEGGTMSVIGGTNCHLCGREKEYENTYSIRKNNGDWKTRRDVDYACGTNVLVSSKGKKTVALGYNCVQLG